MLMRVAEDHGRDTAQTCAEVADGANESNSKGNLGHEERSTRNFST